ncbi:hypothetical protein NBO_2gi002 [Nosema bombycis CQ1]|uniref:Uncharacterized protein n=1 Tax=Nosema bombycis (strain CQ1 / CVCC 102059) TaxID=578461 RepID=R0MC65_NOSB1|nr:hypothetical protein NBO_2gi002 [Nosema bombycis CQ1]|eukprot:EOB15564.1 hypothetical protein NBO_2gi002 [Nosema bombycis CQ1]
MLLHLLIDFKKENWAYVKRDLYNDLLIFLNSYSSDSQSGAYAPLGGNLVIGGGQFEI